MTSPPILHEYRNAFLLGKLQGNEILRLEGPIFPGSEPGDTPASCWRGGLGQVLRTSRTSPIIAAHLNLRPSLRFDFNRYFSCSFHQSGHKNYRFIDRVISHKAQTCQDPWHRFEKR